MTEARKPNPEVEPKVKRRRFTAEYKRRMVVEAEECQHGELGSLLRREGLTTTTLLAKVVCSFKH